jgi:hypothetical protein
MQGGRIYVYALCVSKWCKRWRSFINAVIQFSPLWITFKPVISAHCRRNRRANADARDLVAANEAEVISGLRKWVMSPVTILCKNLSLQLLFERWEKGVEILEHLQRVLLTLFCHFYKVCRHLKSYKILYGEMINGVGYFLRNLLLLSTHCGSWQLSWLRILFIKDSLIKLHLICHLLFISRL